MKFIFIFFPITLISTASYSQEARRDRLDSFFQSLQSYGLMNGNILVAEKDKIVYQRSFGFADLKAKLANSDSSEFTLGSVSKTLTSTAILQLKEKKKLKLDDPFIKYFPGFPYPQILIRHLLSHTSGLPDYVYLLIKIGRSRPPSQQKLVDFGVCCSGFVRYIIS